MTCGGVYPRVCGGTNPLASYSAIAWGLSPRVRGNLHETQMLKGYLRSIPACAGEPPTAHSIPY